MELNKLFSLPLIARGFLRNSNFLKYLRQHMRAWTVYLKWLEVNFLKLTCESYITVTCIEQGTCILR